MDRFSIAAVMFLILSTYSFLLVPAQAAKGLQPYSIGCDQYVDCASASVAYLRSNPDNTLYQGDQFRVLLSVTPSGSGAVTGVAWSYDPVEFLGNATSDTSADFLVKANTTESATVSAMVTFLVTIVSCTTDAKGNTTCNTTFVQTSVQVSVQVQLRAFVLSLKAQLVNATTPLRQVRRNPNGSFYPFDAFFVNYTYSFLFMKNRSDISVRIAPNYDRSVLNLTQYQNKTSTGYFFFRPDNRTGDYSAVLTAKAYNWLGEVIGQKSSAAPYKIIPLVIQFSSLVKNVTDSHGYLLRNPDGSFYRNDSFILGWKASFEFSNARTDIGINVTPFYSKFLWLVNSTTGPLGRNGTFFYTVSMNSQYQPFNVSLRAEAFNYYNDSLALTSSTQPYAVVQYSPYFAKYTYMLYNSRNFTMYQRPFVTLVRYRGNNPGYGYAGDRNTARIINVNDTRERAWINNFTFTTQGWNATVRLVNASLGQDLTISRHPVSVSYRYLNKTCPMITWADRVQKYYFMGNMSDFESYVSHGVIYYNLTESESSKNFAGSPRTPEPMS